MSNRQILALALVLAVVAVGIGLVLPRPATAPTAESVATSTAPAETDWQSYDNPAYGFGLSYPNGATATSTFASFYHLPSEWRYGIVPTGEPPTGQPVVAIVFDDRSKTSGDNQFYFRGEVRVGISTDRSEVKRCLVPGDGQALGNENINGIVFSVFNLSSAGMSQYAVVRSYRTVRYDTCYAVEGIVTGGGTGVPPTDPSHDQALITHDEEFADQIIRTFHFTK